MLFLRVLALLPWLVFGATVLAAAPCELGSPNGSYREFTAIRYGTNPATDRLNLVTPTPARLAALGLARAGAVLVIHGHGARYDDPGFTGICRQLALNGIACASIEYPQADGATAFVWDAYASVNCALRWLRANGPRFGYGAGRIGVYGVSAGGLQAMWQVATQAMTVTPVLRRSVVEPGCPNAATAAGVDAAVIQYAQSDLALPGPPVGSQAALLGAANAADPTWLAEFSPITHLRKAIPQVVSVGNYDSTVNPANTGTWVRRLIALGARDTWADPTSRAACPPGRICGGSFSGLWQYWLLGGFGHGYQVFGTTPNGPNRLVLPTAYSCAVVGFYWKALQISAATPAAGARLPAQDPTPAGRPRTDRLSNRRRLG